MFAKISVFRIIQDHLSTLRVYRGSNAEKSPVSRGDIFLFYVVPIFIAATFYFLGNLTLNSEVISILITSLSVFAALLFNLLILIYDIITKREHSKRMMEFLKEIYANVSYSVLVSVLSVVLLLGGLFHISAEWAVAGINLASFYLVTHFILTLFMILKRTHALLAAEMRDRNREGA